MLPLDFIDGLGFAFLFLRHSAHRLFYCFEVLLRLSAPLQRSCLGNLELGLEALKVLNRRDRIRRVLQQIRIDWLWEMERRQLGHHVVVTRPGTVRTVRRSFRKCVSVPLDVSAQVATVCGTFPERLTSYMAVNQGKGQGANAEQACRSRER